MTATKPERIVTVQGAHCTHCTHCTLPVPAGLVVDGADHQFCCAACRTAFAIINEHGLDDYYAFAERRDRPVTSSGRGYEEFDHEAFRALYVREGADGLAECDLYLDGVHCASCVWLVEKVPLAIPGVVSAELDIGRARCRVRRSPPSHAFSTHSATSPTRSVARAPMTSVAARIAPRS